MTHCYLIPLNPSHPIALVGLSIGAVRPRLPGQLRR